MHGGAAGPQEQDCRMIGALARKLFGTPNDRRVKGYQSRVSEINALEGEIEKLSDEALKARTEEFRKELAEGKSLDDILPQAFATVREAAKRTLGQRHFDVQLVGGMVLHEGSIAEMKTGEGKTLVATLPVYLNALAGEGVHVVTVNDYLAKRDADWMGKVYRFLGLTVGVIQHDMPDADRKAAYAADVTYGTNNELGFDYLRDNMKFDLASMVQRGHHYAIVDEGVTKVEKLLNVDNLYELENMELLAAVNQGLRAHHLFKRDVDYLIKDGKVVIVDEFTGRMMPGRRWSDGLHQAVEAKEGVTIERENQTLATITFQNYFRMYSKLSGMTGTADTEASEFAQIYNLDVTVIPTNRPMIRIENPDVVYRTEEEKF